MDKQSAEGHRPEGHQRKKSSLHNGKGKNKQSWIGAAGLAVAIAAAIPVALYTTRGDVSRDSVKRLPGMEQQMPIATEPLQRTRSHHGDPIEVVPAGQLPSFLLGKPTFVREAYQFAVNNQGILSNIPCYCGCGDMGHESNLSCYLDKNHKGDGKTLAWVGHSAGCDVCLNITWDVIKGMAEGKSVREIRDQVDREYSSVGPGTPTPYPNEGL